MLNMEGAYHTIPIKPDHKRYLVVYFEDLFYMDHDVPFCLASTSGLQGGVANATIDIWEHYDISPAVKWVDNFSIFCFPKTDGLFHGISNGVTHTYGYDLTSIKSIIHSSIGYSLAQEQGSGIL